MSLETYKRLHTNEYNISIKKLDYEKIDSGEIIEKLKNEIKRLEEDLSMWLKIFAVNFFVVLGLMVLLGWSGWLLIINVVPIFKYFSISSKISEKEDYKRLLESIKPFARGVLDGDKDAYISVFEKIKPFIEINDYIDGVSLYKTSRNNLGVVILAEEDNIPKYTERVVNKGKKNEGVRKDYLSNTAFNLLYQTYISSCALRIANDIFFVFPNLNAFVVNVKNKEGVKISVIMQRDRIVGVYRESPQELLRELPHHNISFSARNGAYNVDMLDFR